MTDRQFGSCFSAAESYTKAEKRRRDRARQAEAPASRTGRQEQREDVVSGIMFGHQAKLAIDAAMIFSGHLIALTLRSAGRFVMHDIPSRVPAIEHRRAAPIEPARDDQGEDWTKLRDTTANPATTLDPVTAQDEAAKKAAATAHLTPAQKEGLERFGRTDAYFFLFHKIVSPSSHARNRDNQAGQAMRKTGEPLVADFLVSWTEERKAENADFQALRAHMIALSESRDAAGKKIGEAEAARRSMDLIRSTAIRWKQAIEDEKARKIAEIDGANADLDQADEIARALRQP